MSSPAPNVLDDLADERELATAAKLDALTYDRQREAIAARLNIRVATLDNERAKRRTKENDGAPAFTLEDPEPWPDAVDGGELAEAMHRELARYVVMAEAALTACTLWALMTWLADALFLLPILSVESPQKRCGKSTCLMLLAELTRRSLLAANVTASILFRSVEKFRPTLLLDEADAWLRENEELRGVINAGHSRKTAVVMRSAPDTFEPVPFSTFCPKAIAAIGELADTIADRSIKIALRRRAPMEAVERLRQDKLDLTNLRRQCLRWATDSAAGIKAADPDVPHELHDRAADNWRPLLAIADLIGGDWPRRARSAAVTLTLTDAGDDDIKTRLLADIRDVLAIDPRIASVQLADRLVKLEDRPWSEWRHGRPITPVQIARLLRPFRIAPRTMRFGLITAKGYDLEAFADAFMRYLPKNEFSSVTSSQPLENKPNGHARAVTRKNDVTTPSRNMNFGVTDQNSKFSNENKDRYGVTDQNAENGPADMEAFE